MFWIKLGDHRIFWPLLVLLIILFIVAPYKLISALALGIGLLVKFIITLHDGEWDEY